MPRLHRFSRPQVLAHRMIATGLPENTVPSLRAAIKSGVDWVEFDVKLLADGELVSMHDATVDRTTDGTGPIVEMTLPQVKRLDAGKGYGAGPVAVPTVDEILEVLSTCGRFVRAEMHIHNLWEPEGLIASLKRYGVHDRCYFNCNGLPLAMYIREDLGDSTTLISLNAASDKGLADISNGLDLSYLCVPADKIDAGLVDRVHAFRAENEVYVHCYPVQNERDWKKMVDAGVDVIQTDFPEALFEFLEEIGFKR